MIYNCVNLTTMNISHGNVTVFGQRIYKLMTSFIQHSETVETNSYPWKLVVMMIRGMRRLLGAANFYTWGMVISL